MARPSGPLTLEGTIRHLGWYPDRFIPGTRVSGTAGGDRTIPAHYKISFKQVSVTQGDPQDYARMRCMTPSLEIAHQADDGFLKPDMKIRILGLRQFGDEGGIYTTHDGVEVLSHPQSP